MNFDKHTNALNTVYYALYGKKHISGSRKVASLFYYQNYTPTPEEVLEELLMQRTEGISEEFECIEELDAAIAHTKQLIEGLNAGGVPCH